MKSILSTIKKLLGIDEDYAHFDPDIIIYINSAISALRQIGVGPSEGYSIVGAEETWEDYLKEKLPLLTDATNYIYLKTRIIFDPPANSFVLDAIERTIKELEWRLNFEVEATV